MVPGPADHTQREDRRQGRAIRQESTNNIRPRFLEQDAELVFLASGLQIPHPDVSFLDFSHQRENALGPECTLDNYIAFTQSVTKAWVGGFGKQIYLSTPLRGYHQQ